MRPEGAGPGLGVVSWAQRPGGEQGRSGPGGSGLSSCRVRVGTEGGSASLPELTRREQQGPALARPALTHHDEGVVDAEAAKTVGGLAHVGAGVLPFHLLHLQPLGQHAEAAPAAVDCPAILGPHGQWRRVALHGALQPHSAAQPGHLPRDYLVRHPRGACGGQRARSGRRGPAGGRSGPRQVWALGAGRGLSLLGPHPGTPPRYAYPAPRPQEAAFTQGPLRSRTGAGMRLARDARPQASEGGPHRLLAGTPSVCVCTCEHPCVWWPMSVPVCTWAAPNQVCLPGQEPPCCQPGHTRSPRPWSQRASSWASQPWVTTICPGRSLRPGLRPWCPSPAGRNPSPSPPARGHPGTMGMTGLEGARDGPAGKDAADIRRLWSDLLVDPQSPPAVPPCLTP